MPNNTDAQYIGLMSGTSLDGIDGVRVHFAKDKVEVLQTAFIPYTKTQQQRFKRLFQTGHDELHESQVLAIEHSKLANEVVQKLLVEVPVERIVAIGNHGQTVRHQPNGAPAYSLQLGNGAYLAELSGITTVMDFRSRDLAAGGQGAPLAPAFHQAVFAHPDACRAIVNIGGIANITLLTPHKPAQLLGFDSGPGNTLMDEWAKLHLNNDYDANGVWAQSGQINQDLLNAMMAEPFLKQAPPKSTGQDLFNLEWLRQLAVLPSLSPAAVQATLCEFTVQSIVHAVQQFAPQTPHALYICGGGAHNSYLMARLKHASRAEVFTTDKLGIAPQAVEACAFAWLTKQLMAGKTANAPSSTGARHAVLLGAIYPS